MLVNASRESDGNPSGRLWRFGNCEFDEFSRELRVHGSRVELESKPLDVLHRLLLHAGEVVTKDEIPNPQKLDMWLTVNDETRQKGSTKTMIFGVAHIVWYCSQFMVLEPGDVIITGTPPGVALGMKPEPKFLKARDVVKLGVAGLGEQTQKIVRFKS